MWRKRDKGEGIPTRYLPGREFLSESGVDADLKRQKADGIA